MTEVIVPLAQVLVSPDDVDELGWQDRALCAQTDPEAFFPEKGGSTREAKRVCRSCEVRADPQAEQRDVVSGVADDGEFGVRGRLFQAAEETRGPHAARQHGDAHTSESVRPAPGRPPGPLPAVRRAWDPDPRRHAVHSHARGCSGR